MGIFEHGDFGQGRERVVGVVQGWIGTEDKLFIGVGGFLFHVFAKMAVGYSVRLFICGADDTTVYNLEFAGGDFLFVDFHFEIP